MARQARKTAQQVASKWSANLGAATQAITNGVNAVQTAPTQLAAANVQGYLTGVQNAVNSGKWAAALNKVSLSDWKTAMLNKGVQHIQTGAVAGQSKVASAFGPLLQYIYDGRDQINAANPRGTLQQNMQRSAAMIQYMAGYKNQS